MKSSTAPRRVSWATLVVIFLVMATVHPNREGSFRCVMAGSGTPSGPWGLGASRNLYPRPRKSTVLSPLQLSKLQTYKDDHYKQQEELALLRGGFGGFDRPPYGRLDGSYFEYPQPPSSFVRVVGTVTQLLVSCGKIVLPTLAAVITSVAKFYRALPMDAITAQIGLVYCFLGGYYPTLFSALQAAKYCGWNIMVRAVSDLTEEAIAVIDELEDAGVWYTDMANFGHTDDDEDDDDDNQTTPKAKKDVFLKQTYIVLKTVDPMKINTAAGALYTSWLGISTILRKEYYRVIQLSLTLAEGLERVGCLVLAPALNLVIPRDFHRWIPVLLGWTAKAISMKIAWRIERVLTAATSAIAGGAMVARSIGKLMMKYRQKRMEKRLAKSAQKKNRTNNPKKKANDRAVAKYMHNYDEEDEEDEGWAWGARREQRMERRLEESVRKRSRVKNMYDYDDEDEDDDTPEVISVPEQMVGLAVGGLGFYTQMESQYKRNFSFAVPFPMSLVTWPFDLAERWIQWYITERSD